MQPEDLCEICGRAGADILCDECGRVVCDDCYDRLHELCIDCAYHESRVTSDRGLSSVGLRMMGMLLIGIGILTTTLALGIDGSDKGVIALFPPIFGNIALSTFAFGMILFAFFVFASLLPWYIFSKRSGFDYRLTAISREAQVGSRESDTVEYIITTALPARLMNSIYIEADEEEVYLISTEDESFFRSYSVPEGFEVGEIDYDYEGNYLVMKLILKRSV